MPGKLDEEDISWLSQVGALLQAVAAPKRP
jgi:hypothetical protein